MSALAGHNGAAPAPTAGAPCVPQLAPEHCGVLIGPGLSALPPPHATNNGAVASASASPFEMAYGIPLSPLSSFARNFAVTFSYVNRLKHLKRRFKQQCSGGAFIHKAQTAH